LLTSGGQSGDNLRRKELGIAAYIAKPIKQAELWQAIMQALGMPLATDLSTPTLPQPLSENLRLRILLAEDNLVNQRLAVRLLERRGHTVVVANNGREALAALQKHPLDVILMDVQMPDMDGFETTALIRHEEKTTGKHIPIVAMTAYAMTGDRERCLAAGMDHYISKPIRAKELLETVEAISPSTAESAPLAPADNVEVADVLDKDAALTRAGDDRELLCELAELFLRECPRLMGDIRSAIADGDASRLKCAAHSLKGSIDNFAAKSAFEVASRLELSARRGNLSGAMELYNMLEKEMNRLKPVLTAFARGRVRE